ncbi:MAG: spermidine/putrescine ABC transporter substrate-binding protein PotF, partial [Pantoea agglomerans]
DVSNKMNYANGNKASLPLINADVRNNPGIFPTPEAMSKLFVLKVQDPKLDRVRTRAWTKVKSGK